MSILKKLIKTIPPIKNITSCRDYYMEETKKLIGENESIKWELSEYKKGDEWLWNEKIRLENELEKLKLKNREKRNLIAVLNSLQEYNSNLKIDGKYQSTLAITTVIGCPNKCRYCPQKQLYNAYKTRPNNKKLLDLDDFKHILGKVDNDVFLTFAGFGEPFTNPNCTEMINHALDNGNPVKVFTTLRGLDIEKYKSFKDHHNLRVLGIHVPDCLGNTEFPITEEYKDMLKYVVCNQPQYARFEVYCLGVDGGVHPKLADILTVNGGPINSVCNLVYDNYVNHHTAKLACSVGFNLSEGYGMVMPNGDIIPCCNDWELKHVIGNIYEEESFEKIMKSQVRKDYFKGLEDAS